LKAETMPVEIGDPAPDFTATASNGQEISLSAFRGKQSVVIFFYPRDHSLICTQEACSFRDAYEDFVKLGAAVIAVSADSDESHRDFAVKQRLPYPMISDRGNALRTLFKVPSVMFLLPGRVTYVIDRNGIIRSKFVSHLVANQHVEEALETLRQLSSSTDS
jgi:thioredoxin-dependent peroxiredoxin